MKNEIKNRTKKLAIEIIKFCDKLPKLTNEFWKILKRCNYDECRVSKLFIRIR